MNYFWVLFNQGAPDGLVADVVDLKGIAAWEMSVGEPIPRWPTSAYAAVGEGGRMGSPDDVLQTSAVSGWRPPA